MALKKEGFCFGKNGVENARNVDGHSRFYGGDWLSWE